MSKNIITVPGDYLFPPNFKILGVVLLIAALLLAVVSVAASLICLLIGIILCFSRQGLVFEPERNRFRGFYAFLGIKFGQWEKLHRPEKIFINANEASTKINARVTSGYTIREREYSAFLKLENGKKVYLGSLKRKEKLLGRLHTLADFFEIEIRDNSIR